MKTIAFVPLYDSRGKHDMSGAFFPEAIRFLDVHNTDPNAVYRFDNRAPKAVRRRQVVDVLHRQQGLGMVAFFCHGYKTGIQAGFTNSSVGELAHAIAGACAWQDPVVPIYACSTGAPWRHKAPGGDGGFADKLRDALCQTGANHCRIDAHTTVGHATRNPYVRRFEGLGSAVGGAGGEYLVQPGGALWPAWKRSLRSDGPARFEFPTTDKCDILASLQSSP